MHGIKILLHDFALKMQGGLMREGGGGGGGGAYLRDTTVLLIMYPHRCPPKQKFRV